MGEGLLEQIKRCNYINYDETKLIYDILEETIKNSLQQEYPKTSEKQTIWIGKGFVDCIIEYSGLEGLKNFCENVIVMGNLETIIYLENKLNSI